MIIKYEIKWSNECVTLCPHKKLNGLNNIIRVGTDDCLKCPFFVKETGYRELECRGDLNKNLNYDEDYEVPAKPEDFGKCCLCGCLTLKGQDVCMECND